MKVFVAAGALLQIMVAGNQNTQGYSSLDYTYFDPYYSRFFLDEFCPTPKPEKPVNPNVDPAQITSKIEDLIE